MIIASKKFSTEFRKIPDLPYAEINDGKPRPALVIQADAFEALPFVTVLRLSSDIIPAHLTRVTVEPTQANGLRAASQIMIDKAASLLREKVSQVIGHLDPQTIMEPISVRRAHPAKACPASGSRRRQACSTNEMRRLDSAFPVRGQG